MSKAKPIDAMMQMSHWVRVREGIGGGAMRFDGESQRDFPEANEASARGYFFDLAAGFFPAAPGFAAAAGFATGAPDFTPSAMTKRCVCVPTYIAPLATMGVE